jgi:hypothetical protein
MKAARSFSLALPEENRRSSFWLTLLVLRHALALRQLGRFFRLGRHFRLLVLEPLVRHGVPHQEHQRRVRHVVQALFGNAVFRVTSVEDVGQLGLVDALLAENPPRAGDLLL